MSREVAGHYARVLLEVAVESGADLHALADGLDAFAACCSESPDLARALDSPATPRAARAALAETVAQRIAPGSHLPRFVSVLVSRDRADSLAETAAAFRVALDAREGVISAEVTSATALDDGEKAEIATALGESLGGPGGRTRLEFRVEPALLGGIVVRTGNRIYDASLQSELARFAATHGAKSH